MKQLFRKNGTGRRLGLGLTGKEISVIAFLAVSFIAGLVVKYSGWKDPGNFDYSESDLVKKLSKEQEQRIDELKQFADSIRELKEKSTQTPVNLRPDKKININSAYSSDLQLLPGIGEVMAERIIEYREKTGGFKDIRDIKKVKGIGEKKFESIKQYITAE
mgnify:CR=1 FL=1